MSPVANGQLGRRTFLRGIAASAGVALLGGGVAWARPPRRILALAYSASFARDRGVQNLPGNVAGAEFEQDWHWNQWRGDLARLLSQGSYDQVWLWDQDVGLTGVNEADVLALAEWFDMHPNIVLDSRSMAIRVRNNADEARLARNIRDALDVEGGGLWIGASAAPRYAETGNACLRVLESGLFTGTFEDDGPLTGDADHPFLAGVQVDALRFLKYRSFVRGIAPTLGPGGMALHTVVRDHRGNPLITTSIGGPGAFLLADPKQMFAKRPQRKRGA